ncbi:MAG: hypothetical protein PUA63_01955 [Oscillospiraceae bacterium]|nr:hypothetical protein [Oscillospiraceae bacterium]
MADAYEIYNMSHTGEEIDAAVDKANAAVPQTRTVNGKALSADITLSAKDVGALVKSNLLDYVYPVGSIYMSVNSTNPASFLGGTWARIQDRFLLAAGSSYSAGSTGGEATHKITQNELPSHCHAGLYWSGDSTNGTPINLNGGTGNVYLTPSWTGGGSGSPIYTGFTGADAAHNNMPPYLAVYVWKRTA